MPREPRWLGQHLPASEKYGVSITQEQVGTAQQLLQVSVPGCFTDITHFNPHREDIKEPTSNTIYQGFFEYLNSLPQITTTPLWYRYSKSSFTERPKVQRSLAQGHLNKK